MPVPPQALPLRDIIAPPIPGWWPPAPGWWLVAAITLILLWLILKALAKVFRSPYSGLRTAALRELQGFNQRNDLSDAQFSEQVSALLKRVAMVRYIEYHPASLNGEEWLRFLDQVQPDHAFSQSGGQALLDAQYQALASVNRKQLLEAARTWVQSV